MIHIAAIRCATFALLSCLSFTLQAQTPSLCRQVIATAGKSTVRQNIHYEYTIGEAVVATFQATSGNEVFTQGYQQPDECTAVVLSKEAPDQFSVLIYPNPTANFLHLQFEGENQLYSIKASIVDALGKTISTQSLSTLNFSIIDCTTLQAGAYFLFFKNEKGAALGSYPFLKTN